MRSAVLLTFSLLLSAGCVSTTPAAPTATPVHIELASQQAPLSPADAFERISEAVGKVHSAALASAPPGEPFAHDSPAWNAALAELSAVLVGFDMATSERVHLAVRSVGAGFSDSIPLMRRSVAERPDLVPLYATRLTAEFGPDDDHEVPRVRWSTLDAFAYVEGATLPAAVTGLNGSRVRLWGYGVPLMDGQLLLVRQLWSENHGVTPYLNEAVVVTYSATVQDPEWETAMARERPLMLIGDFEVGEVHKDGYVESLYRMNLESAQPLETLYTSSDGAPQAEVHP